MSGPGDDGVEDSCAAVDDSEFVVAGSQASPLFDIAEAPFNDVAALVILGVEGRWATTG